MLQVVLHKFPQTHSVYHFRCRNLEDTVYPLTDILDDLNHQLDLLCQLKFKEDELQYLRSLRISAAFARLKCWLKANTV